MVRRKTSPAPALLFFMVLGCSASLRDPESAGISNLDTIAGDATVMLMHGKESKCGGVAVGPREILTALHCLQGAQTARYVDREAYSLGWESHIATLVKEDKEYDLALLSTERSLFTWAVPRFEELEGGDLVCRSHRLFAWDCGHVILPNAHACIYSDPEDVSCFDRTIEKHSWVTEVNMPMRSGDSGSGLWDVNGHLAGIALAAEDNNARGLYARPLSIVAFLRR